MYWKRQKQYYIFLVMIMCYYLTDSSDDSSDSNSNDNARDHTSTLMTVSENKTNNQSGRNNKSNNQSKRSRKQRSKPSALSPIAEERPRQLRKGKNEFMI